MNERIKMILDAEKSFTESNKVRLVAGNIFDFFMQEFQMELSAAYGSVEKKEIMKDIRGIRDILDVEENKTKREFLSAVVDILENML